VRIVGFILRFKIQRGFPHGFKGQFPDSNSFATAGVDEVVANGWVCADAFAYIFDIYPQSLGQADHFVHEADFGGQHSIGGIFSQLY